MLYIDKHNKVVSKSFKSWTTAKTTLFNYVFFQYILGNNYNELRKDSNRFEDQL
jgi:hypothetical protein